MVSQRKYWKRKTENFNKRLTVTGEIEMQDFVKKVLKLAEKEQISMEVMNLLPHALKKEIKKNSKLLDKEKAFTVSERH